MKSVSHLRAALDESRARTDYIFSLVKPEAMYERGIPQRHRVIFYLGHLEAFDWNQICRWTLRKPAFHQTFDQLFEAGIDPQAGDVPMDTPSDWPALEEVHAYNARVRREVDQVLGEAPEHIIHVAIEHRLMHAETTAFILHHLAQENKIPPPLPHAPECPPPVHQMVDIPEGIATLGRDPSEGFGWDNEFQKHETHIPAFSMSRYNVTNEQYLRFVKDGAAPPPFWKSENNRWVLKTTFQEIPLPLDWPVYVSQEEARAYANWAGLSLPTEEQFHRAAYGTSSGGEQEYPWGNTVPNGDQGNFNFHFWDPISVTATPEGVSHFGVAQLVGNGWEWTSTVFHPFEGFEPIPTYPLYSARFFDQDHYCVKGGGPQTAACLLRRSFRNWFRPRYPYIHAGFRCVKN